MLIVPRRKINLILLPYFNWKEKFPQVSINIMVVTTDAKSTLCGSLTTATQKEKMSHIISPPSTYCQNAMYKEYLCFPTLMLGRLKAEEGDERGSDGWMASSTRWTGV